MSQQPALWSELPSELVYEIFCNLESRREVASARLVCRSFVAAARRLSTAERAAEDTQFLRTASLFRSVRIGAIEHPTEDTESYEKHYAPLLDWLAQVGLASPLACRARRECSPKTPQACASWHG